MSTNNKFPQSYTIRIARSCDLHKIYILIAEEIFQVGIKILIIFLCYLYIVMFYFKDWDIDLLIIFFASTSLSYGVIFFVSYIIKYLFWNQFIKNKEYLIICSKNKVYGFIFASKFQKYSYINLLFVGSRYRRKGLATYLMKQALNDLKYPIYLLSVPRRYLFDFYTSLGFVFAKKNQLPKNLKKRRRIAITLFPMVIEEKSQS